MLEVAVVLLEVVEECHLLRGAGSLWHILLGQFLLLLLLHIGIIS